MPPDKVGYGQGKTGACPGHGTRDADAHDADSRNYEEGGDEAHNELADAGYRGDKTVSEALQGIAENEKKAQHPVHGALHPEIEAAHANHVLLSLAHEDAHEGFASQKGDGRGDA